MPDVGMALRVTRKPRELSPAAANRGAVETLPTIDTPDHGTVNVARCRNMTKREP